MRTSTSGRTARGPVRCHAVARQVARDQVEHAGHRRGAGEPQDRDGARRRTPCRSRCRGSRAPGRPAPGRWRVAAGLELPAGDQQRGDEAAGDQEDAHDRGGRGQQPLGAADPSGGRCLGVAGVALDVGHHRDAGLEAGHAERELGEDQQGRRRPSDGLPCWAVSAGRPVGDHGGSLAMCHERRRRSPRRSAPGRSPTSTTAMPIASVKPRRKTPPSSASRTSVISIWWPCEDRRDVRVLDDVRGRVGGREGHGDDEVGGREAEQHQHEQLALPERTAAAPASRSSPAPCGHSSRDPAVDRQRAEQGQRDQDQGRERARAGRRRAPRCPAGSRGWRSSRRRSGT